MFDRSIVMLDFETTGLSPVSGDRVTEVAALRVVNGRIAERYVSLVNCGIRIPRFISEMTGISQAMLDRAPSVEQVFPELLRFIGNDALAAHNAGFDQKFLLAESARLGLLPAHKGLICTLKLARRVLPGRRSYRLSDLAASLGIPFGGRAHRAEADAEVSAQLLLQLGAQLRRHHGCIWLTAELLEAINRQSAARLPMYLNKIFASHTASAVP